MDVILLQRIESLGQMGDVVKVKPGFARNFLLPQKKAMRATKENLAFFEKQRAQLEAQNLKQRADAQAVADKMGDKFAVVVIRQAGETGMLYGSVSNRDIAVAVTEAGVTVTRTQVLLDQPIKALGLFKTRVALHPEVSVAITVNVAQSAEEAKLQAEGKAPKPQAEAAPAAETVEAPAAESPAAEAAPAEEVAAEKPAKKPRKTKAKAEKEEA
ncbi:MAG: 50S ribosomal protein L9 [Rhodospirillales bacterium]|nr:50S ribosomal protein L9 [Rhodospirillales bacterium]